MNICVAKKNNSERIKWNNHEIQEVATHKYTEWKTVPNEAVKGEITDWTIKQNLRFSLDMGICLFIC